MATTSSPPGAVPADSPYRAAMRETKEHAARVLADPAACPTFPSINRSNGLAEALCYMQGYLAGRMASTGRAPTSEEMRAVRHDVMHDGAVRELVVGMQETLPSPEDSAQPRGFLD